jgi:hypothetical protein
MTDSTTIAPLQLAFFPTAEPNGPAYGIQRAVSWDQLCARITAPRREGERDGPGFCPARFAPEPGDPEQQP